MHILMMTNTYLPHGASGEELEVWQQRVADRIDELERPGRCTETAPVR